MRERGLLWLIVTEIIWFRSRSKLLNWIVFEDREEDEQSEADTFEDSKHDTNYLGVENVLDQFHAHSK